MISYWKNKLFSGSLLLPIAMMAAAAIATVSLLSGCTKKDDRPEIWIYTSYYNYVVQDFDAALKVKFPEYAIKWYQSGGENVAAKINAELLNGKSKADLILSSDLFWYEDLRRKDALLPYESPREKDIVYPLHDPTHSWAVSRFPVMGIAYNADVYSEADAPKSFADLTNPRFKNKVSMGSPLESGTTFGTVALLSQRLGWEYFEKLRANGILSAGGNSAVINRIETRERPVGIVLMENVITARKKNPKLKFVYPVEGAIIIPNPIAIMKSTAHPEATKRIYDFFFSSDGQLPNLKGDIYGAFADMPAPGGERPFTKILSGSKFILDQKTLVYIRDHRDEIKSRFAKLILE